MKYSELIEKYLNGELEAGEKALLENEIEKHEAIADYIAERDEEALSELSFESAEPADEDTDLTKRIKRQMRRAFAKAGLITGLIVLGAVLFVLFALPGLVSKAYYDPAEKVGTDIAGSDVSRLAVDLSVYTELFVPENVRQNAMAESEGYGNYTVYIPQEHSSSGVFRDTAGTVKKNRLTLYDPNLLKMPASNCFETNRAGVQGGTAYESGWDFDAESYLEYFPESGRRGVYVTLEKAMSYSEFAGWCEKNGVEPYWCAVCSNGYSAVPYNFGFLSNAPIVIRGLNGALADKYPYLTPTQMAEEDPAGVLRFSERKVKAHLTEMLRYLANDTDGLAVLSGYEKSEADLLKEQMNEAAQSIEEHGFEIYGFMVFADKAEAARLCGLDGVIWLVNGSAE